MALEEKPVVCDESTCEELQALADNVQMPKIAMRASIVLESLDGSSCAEVAARLNIDYDRVYLWRQRFNQYGIDGLRDFAKYRERKIIGEDPLKQQVLALLDSDPPAGRLYWSTNALAEALNVSKRDVQRCLQREKIKMLEKRLETRKRKWERRFGNQTSDNDTATTEQ